MRISTFIYGVYQDYIAWRRGWRRIAPYGARGRVFEERNPVDPPSGGHAVETKTTYTTLARVIHADGRPDEHYNLTEDTKLSSDDFSTLKGGTIHG